MKERYEFDPKKAYRLIAVTDKEGNDKSKLKSFYKDRIGGVSNDFRYDDYPVSDDLYRLNINFTRNQDGRFANRGLHTSVVFEVKETDKGLEVITAHSIYEFEEAAVNDIPIRDDKNVIELFISNQDYYKFAKGFYHDEEGKIYELISDVHVGMFTDSVIVRFIANPTINGCACRYFPERGGIIFYNTIYGQQDYSTPLLIHNTGKDELQVRFERHPFTWTITPGENKRIIPYTPNGADPMENE